MKKKSLPPCDIDPIAVRSLDAINLVIPEQGQTHLRSVRRKINAEQNPEKRQGAQCMPEVYRNMLFIDLQAVFFRRQWISA